MAGYEVVGPTHGPELVGPDVGKRAPVDSNVVVGPIQGPELVGPYAGMGAYVASNEVVGSTHGPEFIGPDVGKFSEKNRVVMGKGQYLNMIIFMSRELDIVFKRRLKRWAFSI